MKESRVFNKHCLSSKKDGKEFAMKELMSTSRQASKAAEKEANMLLFLGIYQIGSVEYHFEYCLYRQKFWDLNIFISKHLKSSLIYGEIIKFW